jgi:hypothetical protein
MPKNSFHIQESQSNFGLGFKKRTNLDFENRDKDNVLNWLNHMVQLLKFDPNHLVTIGWSNSYETTRLADR